MRLGEGVEWALHCCLTLAWLQEKGPISTARLASIFDLPSPYLNKCLQPLAKAGILTSSAGAKGGLQLARPPENISLWDVVSAVDGDEPAFRCTEIRQRGIACHSPKQEFSRPCGIASAMHKAEQAWRDELAAQTIADLLAATPPTAEERILRWYRGDVSGTP